MFNSQAVKFCKEGFNLMDENIIYGRNAVIETLRSGNSVDRIYIQENLNGQSVKVILDEAKKHGVKVEFIDKKKLDIVCASSNHQGTAALAASYKYAEVEDILKIAEDKNEPPFIILLDGIEDPHNLGAIIRTANLAGAHGVIIPKNRAAGLTAAVAKTSAGALNYTKVARVANLSRTIDKLKERGVWFVCADMSGASMYSIDLSGAIGIVIGSEGNGVSRLVKEKCDFHAAIPVRGEIDSLNASVAAGVLAYEVVRRRIAV